MSNSNTPSDPMLYQFPQTLLLCVEFIWIKVKEVEIQKVLDQESLETP